jgi:hypothetical protein
VALWTHASGILMFMCYPLAFQRKWVCATQNDITRLADKYPAKHWFQNPESMHGQHAAGNQLAAGVALAHCIDLKGHIE